MNTGKIEFAPDYKSEKGELAPFVGDGFAVAGTTIVNGKVTNNERSRLERKVLEAVKVAWIDGLISSTTLNDAVKALIDFEAKQETK